MLGIIHFGAFAVAAAILIITPGNDTLLILSKSITQGKKAGIISSLGVGTGSTIHTFLAAFGLSIIIAKSLLVFTVIKYAGAAYLAYTGIRMIASRTAMNFDGHDPVRGQGTSFILYRQAVLTDVLNPKVAMFYIAFLPQFIDAGYAYNYLSFIVLGLMFTITGTLWCIMLAIFSSGISVKMRTNNKALVSLNKIFGSVLVLLGIELAFVKRA